MRALALAAALLAMPAGAVEPGERLADPALEARARALSQGLRCVVCRNESIDESSAEMAAEMRVALRERIAAGDDDAEAVAWLVDRYGEYVLLRPTLDGANWVLWGAPLALLLAGGGLAAWRITRQEPVVAEGLDAGEEARVAALMGREGPLPPEGGRR